MKTKAIILIFTTVIISIAICNPMKDKRGFDIDTTLMDVHGAGAQRSDPKIGDPKDYPSGHGPQGDVIRIYNYVRPVRSFSSTNVTSPVVDTNQKTFYNNRLEIPEPSKDSDFYGQDASYSNLKPSYSENGDGTVSDLNTGLMWQQNPGEKLTLTETQNLLRNFSLGGYSDWRLPTIKELYSLILFSGRDISVEMKKRSFSGTPFLDTEYFAFEYGNPDKRERPIDSQYLSSTKYVSTTMAGDETWFGVNMADGRIKGYPKEMKGSEKKFVVIFVRGNNLYGENNLVDNGDGTITDKATGLMWLKEDSMEGMTWQEALKWCEDLNAAGYDDWRLPDAKELQSLVDYSRSPDTTNSAAIDPLFNCSTIMNEGGEADYPFYWSSTTHADSLGYGTNAVYVAFGRALGFMASKRGRLHGSRPPRF